MDNYLSIFRAVLSTEGNILDVYLENLNEHKIFGAQKNDEASLMQHITALLTTSTTRLLGFRLLDKFIDNCSVDVLEKKADLWTTLALKACNNEDPQCNFPLIFHVINKIIKSSQKSADLAKSFTSSHSTKIYDCLTNVPLSKTKDALNCIETCLRLYPGSSGPSRASLERFLWKHIDHIDYAVVQNCGRSLHLLQQVKRGGVQGVNQKTQWKTYQLQLMGAIHSLYNEMFENCTEMYEEKIEDEKLPGDVGQIQFDPEPVKKAAQMYIRCRNLITFLTIALREEFPVEKPILVKKILNIVIRGLSVNCLMLERNPIADNIALSVLLPRLHIDLLNLLNAAVKVLRGHLRPYSEIILSLMIDVLKWTTAKSLLADQKILLSLRKKVYDTVSLWCKIFHNGNRCETICEDLFQEILSDVTPPQTELTLKVLSGTRKHMSKKARRQLHNAHNEKSNMSKNHSGTDRNLKQNFSEKAEQDLCVSALRCLQEIILSVANFMKPTVLKMMQISLTQISAIFYEFTLKSNHLYSNKNCRIEIYYSLYVILMTTHRFCPPPTDLVLATIQTACVRDDNLKVRSCCSFILQNLEKIIHPQKESLLYAIEARDVRNTFIKMGQENLLNEFGINLSNLSSNDNTIDDDTVATDYEIVPELDNNEMEEQALSISSFESDKIIQNTQIDTSDFEIVETVQCQINDISDKTLRNTIENIDDNLSQSPELQLTANVNIAAEIDETEYVSNNLNSEEPLVKKQKFDEDNQTDVTVNSNDVIGNMDFDENQILAEIESEFVDELQ